MLGEPHLTVLWICFWKKGDVSPELGYKGTLLGNPNREPREYNGNIPTRVLIFHYIPMVFLGFPFLGQ